jgi:hypothetical protein
MDWSAYWATVGLLLLARGILLGSASHASLIFFFRCW